MSFLRYLEDNVNLSMYFEYAWSNKAKKIA